MNELQKVFVAMQKAKNWMKDANCKNMEIDLFFVENGANIPRFTKEVCDACPVLDECAWFANETSADHGIFAGMSPRVRRQWRRKNNVMLGMSKQDYENRNRGYLRTPIAEWSTL
jgi:WhiB family redox-sensing transcriptional regulator